MLGPPSPSTRPWPVSGLADGSGGAGGAGVRWRPRQPRKVLSVRSGRGLGTTPLPPVLSLRHLSCPPRTRVLFRCLFPACVRAGVCALTCVCAHVCLYARARARIVCMTAAAHDSRTSVQRSSVGFRAATAAAVLVCGGLPQCREIVPRALNYLATPWSAQHSSLQALVRRQSGRRTAGVASLTTRTAVAGWC